MGVTGRAPAVSFTRKAIVRDVIDGDTIAVDVDLGFLVFSRLSCRVAGIDAPEHNTPEGQAAKTHLAGMLPAGTPLVVDSIRIDKYGGRFDANVWTLTGVDVGASLVAAGQAKRWAVGKEPKPYPLP